MTSHPRSPLTPLARVCPAYAQALNDYERAMLRDDERAMAEAWGRAVEARQRFDREGAS